VGIIGASGYSGIELTRLCARHPRVDLCLLASDRWAGDTPRRRLGIPLDLAYTDQARALEAALACEAVFLATPAEASLELAPRLVEAGVQVIDLSGAFRLKDAAEYPRWYGFSHPRPGLLAQAAYGIRELPGLRGLGVLADTRLVANPGCYATAAALAMAPLLAAGVIDGPVIIDAASGTSGAGRKASEDMSLSELDGDFRAYRVLRHQHTPEIAATLATAAGHQVGVTFTAHLLPMKRGILATCYARLAAGHDPAEVMKTFMNIYATAPFVRIVPTPDDVRIRDVARTNHAVISGACDGETVIAVCAIDNLLKGAAGQAVQNLNLMMGWDESAGLDGLAFHGGHP
jgi:N-acetyl-gamma-glutamyl-phosphate reductase